MLQLKLYFICLFVRAFFSEQFDYFEWICLVFFAEQEFGILIRHKLYDGFVRSVEFIYNFMP